MIRLIFLFVAPIIALMGATAASSEFLRFSEVFRQPSENIGYLNSMSDDGTMAIGGDDIWDGGIATIWPSRQSSRVVGTLSQDQVFGSLSPELVGEYDPNSRFTAMSADGRIAVGFTVAWQHHVGNDPVRETNAYGAFRWTAESGLEALDRPDGFEYSIASDVSHDGSIVVGGIYDVDLDYYEGQRARMNWQQFLPVRWTNDGVDVIPLVDGYVNGRAERVSGDGKTVTGVVWADDGWHARGFIWTEARGIQSFADQHPNSGANDVSNDGNIVVGRIWEDDESGFPDLRTSRAVVWTPDDGVADLPGFSAAVTRSSATRVLGNGELVFGYYYEDGQLQPEKQHWYVWDQARHVRNLKDVLSVEYGLAAELSAWEIKGISGVSADGRILHGSGEYLGEWQQWIAFLDSSLLPQSDRRGDFDLDGQLTITDVDRLSEAIQNSSTDSIFDLDDSGIADRGDLQILIQKEFRTYFGDANLDGEFKSSDFVAVFGAGQYETQQQAGWGEGDWNADGRFDSGDFVVAFLDGGYEQGLRPAVAVPEPSAAVLCLIGLFAVLRYAAKHSVRS